MRHDNLGTQRIGPCDSGVDVIDLKPKEQAVSRRQVVRIADESVVMLLLPEMKLQDQLAGVNQTLVVRPAVGALAAEQPLIPPAACLDIPNADQRLRSYHLASPYRTPSQIVGSSGVVQINPVLSERQNVHEIAGPHLDHSVLELQPRRSFQHDHPLMLWLVVPEVCG
jgi:hypothetical protein